MAIFHFSQLEYELFWRYFKRLNIFLAQCGYYVSKWEILDITDDCVNSKTWILLEYCGFLAKSVDDVWYMLEWIAWNSFEFEKASRVSRYSFFFIRAHSVVDLLCSFLVWFV